MRKHQNLQLLGDVASRLTPLLQDLVFVGGCTTELLITDEAAVPVRTTKDVDAVMELGSYGAYMKVAEQLRGLGFTEDQSEGAPMCRWRTGELILDVMPDDERALGFTNRWYKQVLQTANYFTLDEHGVEIRVVSPPYFVGTKLEAFKGRGHGDFAMSHDLEDLVSVIDGRPALVDEIKTANPELRGYIAVEVSALLGNEDFIAALPGFLPFDSASQGRLPVVLHRLKALVYRSG